MMIFFIDYAFFFFLNMVLKICLNITPKIRVKLCY